MSATRGRSRDNILADRMHRIMANDRPAMLCFSSCMHFVVTEYVCRAKGHVVSRPGLGNWPIPPLGLLQMAPIQPLESRIFKFMLPPMPDALS